MRYAQTIALARGLLAEGRAADVTRMLEPLAAPGSGDEAGQVVVHALLARVRVLRYGDPSGALALLAPFDEAARRARLAPAVRAEVALWLGWAHAWQDARTCDAARALSLLDEAGRLFGDALNAGGRCWTLMGQALAYAAIDEYPLMQRALREAAALQEELHDVQAEAWIHDLHAEEARFLGHYARAQDHVDALLRLGRAHDDPHVLGRARAHQAVLYFELGRSPDLVAAEATGAAHLLTGSVASGGALLVAACHAHLGALLRRGDWDEVDRLADAMAVHAAAVPGAAAYLLLPRARLALDRGDDARAGALLDAAVAGISRQNRLLTARAALLRAELSARRSAPDTDPDPAQAWASRALHLAREAGHTGLKLHALLAAAGAALDRQAAAEARAALQEADQHAAFFGLLPLAALRSALLGRLAALDGRPADAQAYFSQALSAFTLVGDTLQVARMQVELARLARAADPPQGRALLDAALPVLARLQARPDLDAARALDRAWPTHDGPSPAPTGASVGAALARAAVSVDLVAEAWLQAVERHLPGHWLAVYRCDAGAWRLVHAHGRAPAQVAFPDAPADEARLDGVAWLRLRPAPGPAFFFAAAPAGPAADAALALMRPWLPVAALALDHALLRAAHLDPRPAASDEPAGLPLDGFVHASPALRDLVRKVHRLRSSHSPVLITGEPGTGKALVARAVHAASERHEGPFVAFDCAAARDGLDALLFGCEDEGSGDGASADRSRTGAVRAADGGTLFLDEVGDLPLDVQPALLRFLEVGEVFPVGARRPVPVDVRVVAATSRDLEQRIREGLFREDLYYRLNVVPLRVPPLRDRREDIPLLVRHFVAASRPTGAPLASLTNRAMEALMAFDWPGNVRQLRDEVERALAAVGSEPAPLVDLKDLSPEVTGAGRRPTAPAPGLDDVLAGAEKALLERVLAEQDGRISAAAHALGLTRQGLYKKMKRLGIPTARFRTPSPA